MITSRRAQHPLPIAVVGVGPAGQSALQRLNAEQLPNIHLLRDDGSLVAELLHKVGLLILVAKLESVEDSSAVQALAQQVQSSGFGTNTLFVAMKPGTAAGAKQKALAHYSLQVLEMLADATVVLSKDDGEDLCTWLTDRIAGVAQVRPTKKPLSVTR